MDDTKSAPNRPHGQSTEETVRTRDVSNIVFEIQQDARTTQITTYLAAGLALIAIPSGQKGPESKGWNERSNAITTLEQAAQRLNGSNNIGLAHAYCTPQPTCALDVDDLDRARDWLAKRGIDLDDLLNAPSAVRIKSPRHGSEKVLYRLPNAIPSVVIKGKDGETLLEFRCASKGGKTMQDVLPPSLHPLGAPYTLLGDIKAIPPIPEALMTLWLTHSTEKQHKGRNAKANVPTYQTGLPPRFQDLLANDGELRRRWEGKLDGLKDASRSGLDMSLVAILVHRGFSDVEITTILHAFPHGKVVQDGRDETYIAPMLAKARETRRLSRIDPMRTARRMIAERFTDTDGAVLLRHWRGDFYQWQVGVYRRLESNDVKTAAYHYLEGARVAIKKDATESFMPKQCHVNDVLDALKACVHLDSLITPPCQLDGDGDATNLIAMGNGMLDLTSRQLLPFDPALFLLNGVPFDYNPEAEPPMAWLKFLHQLWPDDPESIETLQEFFGYMLSSDTSRQKILLLDGPKRAGKGVIADILSSTIGAANCIAPTLSSLGTNFGLQPLIGKSLAIVSDARLGRVDLKVLAERLLSISGQDTLSIPQKYKGDWTGKLGVRLMILTNELPEIEDESGALASRFIVLRLTESFYGREDFGLKDRLMQELPDIFNWALRGLKRLKARGQFRQPATAKELVHELENLGSPMSAFLSDCCVVEPAAMVEPQVIFQRWQIWCHTQGIDRAGSLQTFCRNLRAALPSITIIQPRENGNQKRCYTGVGLKTEMAAATPQEIRKRLF